jgi:hypothetical protein
MQLKIIETNHKITHTIGLEDFLQAIGRKPKDQKEFDRFVELIGKGIDAQLDWDILYSSAGDVIKEEA